MVALCVLFVVGQYAVLAWLVPRFVIYAVEHVTGGDLFVEQVRLSFPLTTILTGVRLVRNTEEAAFSVRRIVIRPRWISLTRRTLWLDSLDIEGPLVRVSRSRAGTTRWPTLSQPFTPRAPIGLIPWRIHVGSVNVADGALELQDREPAPPFHGILDHIWLSVGPLTLPPREAHRLAQAEGRSVSLSFAVRGAFTGRQGDAAPFYCSGWTDLTAKDLQASCQAGPIPLAAFEPYFTGRTQLRAYATTITSTSHWSAKANDLTGRVQLTLGHLIEGDLSFRGRTVVDVKKLAGGPELRLSGAIVFNGPLDQPGEWDAEFLPGDRRVQLLVERLFEYGVRLIKVPVGPYMMYVRIAPATPETMTDIEAVSREVQDALELLAQPPAAEGVPAVPPAAPTPEPAPAAATPPALLRVGPTTAPVAIPANPDLAPALPEATGGIAPPNTDPSMTPATGTGGSNQTPASEPVPPSAPGALSGGQGGT